MGGRGSGGRRESSGRKPVLRKPRKLTVAVDDEHVQQLARLRDRNQFSSLAEAVRFVIRDWLAARHQ